MGTDRSTINFLQTLVKMGQCCAKCYVSEEEMELSKNIESSYTVKKDNLCKFGFCSGTENFVRRDVENNGKQYPSMDLLFDDIDKALSVSIIDISATKKG